MVGLNVTIDQFKKLPNKDQMAVLYKNTEELKVLISGFKFQQKAQWMSIIFLGALIGLKDRIVELIW